MGDFWERLKKNARTEKSGHYRALRAKNDTGRTFSTSHELPKQAGATGIQLNCHLKFLNLKRFDEERNRLVWVSACYEIIKQDINISGLFAFFE
jgi:hypothetical protein